MRNNLLVDRCQVITEIDSFITKQYKSSFIQTFGEEVWDKIIAANGIPIKLHTMDDAIYLIESRDDEKKIIKRRFTATRHPNIDIMIYNANRFCENFKDHPNKYSLSKSSKFDIVSMMDSSITINDISLGKYRWFCALLTDHPEYGLIGDTLYL